MNTESFAEYAVKNTTEDTLQEALDILEADDGKSWEETKGWSIGMKEQKFKEMHSSSMACAIQLFENADYSREIGQLRNYVDHFKYYVNHEKSITDLYDEFFTKFFGYSSKLRRSVLVNFSNVLEKYFLENGVTFETTEDGIKMNLIATLTSQKFTYKLQSKGKQKDFKGAKPATCQGAAKSAKFVKNVKQVLLYKV